MSEADSSFLSSTDYVARARAAGINIFSVAECDINYNSRKVLINPANPTNNTYSVAKAFTVLALGMCADRGLLSPSDKAARYLGKYYPTDLSPDAAEKWNAVTIDNIMKHRTGFGSGLLDIDAEDASEYPSKDYLSIVLSAPLVHAPGEVRQYTDASYYLLSRIITEVTGMALVDFLRPCLLGTMNFGELAWSCCPQGYSMGATGLYIRTEDMVKLGVLWLRGGEWHGERIVSGEWTKIVTEREYEFHPLSGGWYGKGGMRGQMLCFNPEKKLAVAWQAFERKVPFESIIEL